MSDPLDVLREVAVPDRAVAAYAALVRDPDVQPDADVAGELVGLGLAQPAGDGVQPLPPLVAVGALVRRRRRALMEADARLMDAVAAAEELQVAYELAQERRGRVPLIEILTGYRSADATVARLVAEAREVTRCFLPGPTSTAHHEPSAADLASLARGLDLRCIYGTTYLDEAGALSTAAVLRAAGEQQRVHSRLPMTMLIFDDDVAVLPTDRHGHPSRGAAIVRSSSVVSMCIALFEEFWRQALPLPGLGDAAEAAAASEADAEAEVVRLLLAGFQDERIARELGLSVRTVRRRIRGLMDRHGVASRTQLGAALARADGVAAPA
jgi:DNA-binding CsgD family transcriptional regulator